MTPPAAIVHYVLDPDLNAGSCANAITAQARPAGELRDLTVFRPDGPLPLRDVHYDSDPAEPAEGTWHFADWCPARGKDAPGRKAMNEAALAEALESERITRSWGIAPGQPAFEPDQAGVHAAHCCSRHGCKYGNAECPVARGAVKQDYPCEACGDQDVLDKAVTRLYEIEAHLTTIGQRIGSSPGDGEPGIIAQLARMEALQAVTARQTEEIHRTLGLERDEDDAPVPPPMTAEQQELLFRLTGRDPDMPGRTIIVGEQSAFEAARAVTSAAPAWIMSGISGHAIAVIIPAADWHEPGTCCCKNCPWNGNHGPHDGS